MASKSERKKKDKISDDRSISSKTKTKKKSFLSSFGSLFSCMNCKSGGRQKKKTIKKENGEYKNGAVGNIPTNEGTPVPCSDNTIGTGVIKPVVSDSELNLVINATIVNSDENTLVTSQAENGTSALNSELYVSLESDLSQSVAVSITENQSVPASCKSIPSSTASTQSVQQDEPEELLPINNTEVEREVPEADQPVSEKSLQVKETETNQSVDVNNNELEVTEEPISSQVELTVNTIAVSSELVSEQVVIVTDRPSTPPPQSVPVQKEPVVVSVTVPETKPVAAMPTKPTETPAALTDNKPSSLVKERIASYAAIIASNKPEDKKTTASAVVAPAKPPRLAQNQQPVVKTESAPIVKPVATSTSVNQNSTPTTAKPIVNSPLKKTQSYASDSQTRKSPVSSAGQALVKNEKVVVKRSNTNTSTAKPETRGKKQDEVVTPPSRDKKSAVVEVKNGSVDRGEESASTITYEEIVVYEFNFPRRLCGKLIGKSGVHVDNIRTRTRTQIAVRNDPSVEDLQIVCVSGKLEDVDHALEIISNRFPAKHYSSVSFKPITKPIVYRRQKSIFENNLKVFLAPNMFVELLQYLPTAGNSGKTGEVGNSDFVSEDKFPDMALAVHVASVVNAAHVFIQLPSNPMFEHLPKLDTAMTDAYNAESGETEQLLMSEPVENGTICAAPTSFGWHRVVVTNYMSKTDVLKEISDYDEPCGLVTIKFLDYGGYLTIPANQLRQLRSDFMLLPFQSIECYLDGIYPVEGTEDMGKSFLKKLIRTSKMKGILTGYADDGTPTIRLYVSSDVYANDCLNTVLVGLKFACYSNGDTDSAFGSLVGQNEQQQPSTPTSVASDSSSNRVQKKGKRSLGTANVVAIPAN